MAMTKIEKLSHYAVVLIAVMAVGISVWQGRISQRQLELTIRHNQLSVKPFLDATRFTSSDDHMMEVLLSNQGYGPAIVKKFELIYEGKSYPHWNAVFDASGENENIRYLRNYAEGSVIAPGREDALFRLKTSFENKGITLKVTYQSIYEEVFELDFTF